MRVKHLVFAIGVVCSIAYFCQKSPQNSELNSNMDSTLMTTETKVQAMTYFSGG